MIYDCFLFNDELDVLEMRLAELESVVDKFVLVESKKTFQGGPKPLYFATHAERFARWAPRIIHGTPDREPELAHEDPWKKEAEQREHIRFLLEEEGTQPNDLILLSDVDEIPSRDFIRLIVNSRSALPVVAQMRLMCFAVDLEHPATWLGTVAMRYREIASFQTMRDTRGAVPAVPGGFHFTWLGTPWDNERKRNSFSHTEVTAAQVTMNRLAMRHVDGAECRKVPVDDTWPRCIREKRCPACWFSG